MTGPKSERDVYANLLRETRGMRREHGLARDAWFSGLAADHKEGTLFELEMLLKGLVCFGNPRNHPGPPRRTPGAAHDFGPELRATRDAIERVVALVQKLLGEKDRAYTFTRYLETVMPGDSERTRLLREQVQQDTPEDSLFLLRNSFGSYLEICDGLLRLGRISHRTYLAVMSTLAREIGRNVHFNPLVELEFRAEFDRIRSPEVLDALARVESETAHRVGALTFLTLFRALRYLSLIDGYAQDKREIPLAYLIFGVLRSDLRTLTRYLTRHAADAIAEGFERELLAVPASELGAQEKALARTASSLVSFRGTFEASANMLRVEVKRALERILPSIEGLKAAGDVSKPFTDVSVSLRATIQHMISALSSELDPRRGSLHLAESDAAKAGLAERLRADVWMFSQILRAFLAKASVADDNADVWSGRGDFSFVRQFLSHFRAIGYPLVRLCAYDGIERFLTALESIRDVDLLEPRRLADAVVECQAFYEHLTALFKDISARKELEGVPFDRLAAAESLKIYLGAA